jgi:hypothetical protein
MLLAWAQLVAGIADSMENLSLIELLLGSENQIWPRISFGCALVKFSLVGFGLFYVVTTGWIALLNLYRNHRASKHTND